MLPGLIGATNNAPLEKNKAETLSIASSYSCVSLTKLFMDVVNIVQGISLPDFRLKIFCATRKRLTYFCNM